MELTQLEALRAYARSLSRCQEAINTSESVLWGDYILMSTESDKGVSHRDNIVVPLVRVAH